MKFKELMNRTTVRGQIYIQNRYLTVIDSFSPYDEDKIEKYSDYFIIRIEPKVISYPHEGYGGPEKAILLIVLDTI